MKPDGNDNKNNNFFDTLLTKLGVPTKSESKSQKKPKPAFDRDTTMTLKHYDYSNIGGPQVGEQKPASKEESKQVPLIKSFALEQPKQEEKKVATEKIPEIKKNDPPPKPVESTKKEEMKPVESAEKVKPPKESTMTKPKEDTSDITPKKSKKSKKSGESGMEEASLTEVKKGGGAEKKESKEGAKGSAEPKKSKKVPPTMEGKDLVSAAEEMKKTAKKSAGDTKVSKKRIGSTGKKMSGNDVKPKEDDGANKKGTKKAGEKKISEGLEGAKVETKS